MADRLVVASHKANSITEAKALQQKIQKIIPDMEIVVVPQATGLVVLPEVKSEPEE